MYVKDTEQKNKEDEEENFEANVYTWNNAASIDSNFRKGISRIISIERQEKEESIPNNRLNVLL